MLKHITYRIILDILIALLIFYAWWFVALPLALIGTWRYPYFVEIIIAGFLYDSLFAPIFEMSVIGYIGTISAIVLFAGSILLKKLLRK
ncbi:MAG: hypothetical protein RL536_211 [Candidatus Parcubacteria bacterium]|jgi:hypothetical protein